ncbi:hypothetical protein [Xanthomonas translucens]|uniref:hypothetical protein n=1 Tax=Xanthomonas campestris pv. translucens TaxID=343 RepID=UPI000AF7FF7F|nr:hypothetical protein [Xanthomonas translucens]MBC3972632.1 hypothetical protein [Xanthomonas translucens pv. undulosa]MCT8271665.1 hypothetical protein [Xanthomonas translucens pv. undulosa]MCT8281700.1 hypothetical protein [Xanthomonas translucens pv. undulosa]MCT8316391.1 hypothetical protein [Xanthomonas translucens pv. undulosa]QEN95005.1 hypothetical protein F0H33_18030 [Xanthomonas translucens pv. undulosa]
MSPFPAEKCASPPHFSQAHMDFDGAHETLPMHSLQDRKFATASKFSMRGTVNDGGPPDDLVLHA